MNEMNFIRVPRALEGLEPLALDMTKIRQAEGRLPEVALTNSHRAPELLALFNGGYLDVSRYLNLLEYEMDVAERRLAEAKATFLIDKLPSLLADKGFASARSPLGSEDIRQAFLDRDDDYKRFQDLICVLRSYIGLFETLQTGFENGYNSVKKLIGTDSSTWRQNPNLTQPSPSSPDPVGSPFSYENAVGTSDDFFGTPK